MKRKVISVLALTLIVLMSAVLVSCDGWKQVAPDETVNLVVNKTLDYIKNDFGPSAEQIAAKADVDIVKSKLYTHLYNEYHDIMPDFNEDDVTATSSSLSAEMSDYDGGINRLKVNVTGITYTEAGDKTSGDFTISAAVQATGAHVTMDLKGNFSFSSTKNEIKYSSTVVNGIDYDLAAFNNKMAEKLGN